MTYYDGPILPKRLVDEDEGDTDGELEEGQCEAASKADPVAKPAGSSSGVEKKPPKKQWQKKAAKMERERKKEQGRKEFGGASYSHPPCEPESETEAEAPEAVVEAAPPVRGDGDGVSGKASRHAYGQSTPRSPVREGPELDEDLVGLGVPAVFSTQAPEEMDEEMDEGRDGDDLLLDYDESEINAIGSMT